jgi:hypothetical protein
MLVSLREFLLKEKERERYLLRVSSLIALNVSEVVCSTKETLRIGAKKKVEN